MVTKINDFWWHNAINGNRDAEGIMKDAEHCLRVALLLVKCVEAEAIVLTGGDSSPSLTRWDVLNVEAYAKLCTEHGFEPEDFESELEDESEDE